MATLDHSTLSSPEYLSQIDTFLSLLELVSAQPQAHHFVLIGQMLESLQSDAAKASLPGVAELLRCWQTALQDLGRCGATHNQNDLARMSLWFTCLQEHLAGRLDHDGRRMLAHMPEDIPWLPRLSPSFAKVILRRLDNSAETIKAANSPAPHSKPSLEQEPAFAPPLLDTTMFAPPSADHGPNASEASRSNALRTTISVSAEATTEPRPDIQIWVSQDELELTRIAIVDQLLPLTRNWSETDDTDTAAANSIAEEIGYQCQLIENVIELIGMPTLARGMGAIRERIERRDPAITPEVIAILSASLLDAFTHPGRESAEQIGLITQDLHILDDAWTATLGDELARVVIGLDPTIVAQRKIHAEFGDIDLRPADDVLPSVLDGMLRELPGNAERLGASVRSLAETHLSESIDEARRVAHTLKGDANTVGVRGLANLTHALEDILIAIARQPEKLDAACADFLTGASDCVEEIADHLLGRGPAPSNLLDVYQHALDIANSINDAKSAIQIVPRNESADSPDTERSALPKTADLEVSISAPSSMVSNGIQSLNVSSTLLEELQRLSGESMVTARQIEQQLDSLNSIYREQRQGARNTHELMDRLDDLVALRGAALQSTAQKAGTDLDPLEIDQYNELHVVSRQLLETHADNDEFLRRMDRIMNALSDLRSGQEQLNRDLQRTILRTRTVPFGQISQRLQRITRQTSKLVFKQVNLEIIGEDIPIDAELLERIVEPLAHLLRNAIDHGIEPPADRLSAGKPESGHITIRVSTQSDTALIDLQDDGRGLDLYAIRRRAVDAKLIEADHDIDERQLERLILLPGFSTRDNATEVSGRGIGMDVVNQRIAELRGTLSLSSEAGRGTRVQLRLPVTQTLANVVIARGQHQVNAVVASSVERVISFAAGECRIDEGRLRVHVDGEEIPAWLIESFYGDNDADPSMWLGNQGVGLLVRDALGRANVVLVRAIDEVRSAVIKPLGAFLPAIPAVRGITQLGDGGLAPVIDLDVLLHSALERRFDATTLSPAIAMTPRVVVADDSLSVRRALEQLMQDAGFEVATARDGFEALAEIQAKPTHALLVDLEMPRMNGLEVARNLRNHIQTRDLPVVMITSRTTDKHRAMAEQAGVTRMIGKPFSEDGLVQLVREVIMLRAATVAAATT